MAKPSKKDLRQYDEDAVHKASVAPGLSQAMNLCGNKVVALDRQYYTSRHPRRQWICPGSGF